MAGTTNDDEGGRHLRLSSLLARGLRPRPGGLSQFRWGIVDQSLSGLTNFALGLCVARYLGARSLGQFSVVFTIYLVLLSCSRAICTDPLVVRFSNVSDKTWRQAAALASGAALAAGIVAGLAASLLGLAVGGTTGQAMTAVGLALPGLLCQDSWRYAFIAAGRADRAAQNDMVWAIALFPGLAIYLATARPTVTGFVLVWGGAGWVAGLFGIAQSHLLPKARMALRWWRNHADLGLRYLGESLGLGVGLQLSVFGIGAVAGYEALGTFRAGFVLFSPLFLFLAGLQLVGASEAVRAAERGAAVLRRTSLSISVVTIASAALWGAVASLLPTSFGHAAMGPNWELARSVVAPYTFAAMAAGATAGPVVGLRALAAARTSFRVSLLTAPLVIMLGPVGSRIGGAYGAVWGLGLASAVGAVASWIAFNRTFVGLAGPVVASPCLDGTSADARRRRSAQRRLVRALARGCSVAAANLGLLAVAWWAGSALALGGIVSYGVFAIAIALAGWAVGSALLGHYLRQGFLSVELPVVLMALSTVVLRVRTSDALAFNPLDPAGLFRVGCVAIALALGSAALVSPPLPGTSPTRRLTTLPFRLYGLYALCAGVGGVLSVNPVLTFYRLIEIGAAMAVVAGAYRAVGRDATRRIESALFWFIVVQVGWVWMGVLIWPSRAMVYKFASADSPIPWQLEGVMPALGSNLFGAMAMILAIWSLARVIVRRQRKERLGSAPFFVFFGLASIVLAQYRTAYVAFPLAALVVLVLRWRAIVAVGAALVITVSLGSPRIVDAILPFALRGESTEAAENLSSRTEWWALALPVWKESPVFGRGLLTATRFEVLASVNKETSTIHSTWVETLVGTGLVGFCLLSSALLITFRRAFRAARHGGPLIPVGICVVIAVHSVTGNTIESFSVECLLFLALAISLADPQPGPSRAGAPATAHFGRSTALSG